MQMTTIGLLYLSCFKDVRMAVLKTNFLSFVHSETGPTPPLATVLLARAFLHGEYSTIVPLLQDGCWGKKKCKWCNEHGIMADNLLYLLLIKRGHAILKERLIESNQLFKQFEAIGGARLTELFGPKAGDNLKFLNMITPGEKISKLERMYVMPLKDKPETNAYGVNLAKLQLAKEVAAYHADENMRKLIAEEELLKQRKEARKEVD